MLAIPRKEDELEIKTHRNPNVVVYKYAKGPRTHSPTVFPRPFVSLYNAKFFTYSGISAGDGDRDPLEPYSTQLGKPFMAQE
jgi:hypothetical protein